MGQVAAILKVFPEGPDALESVKKSIEETIKPVRIEEEPIAFGLKALRITVILSDDAGSEGLEEKVRAIAGVSEVQVEEVGRL